MELRIMSQLESMQYVPKDKTYAVRIFNPRDEDKRKIDDRLFNLVSSSNYIKINEYEFSDMDPEIFKMAQELTPNSNETLFDEGIARKILSDFVDFKNKCDTFLVHCQRGKNRSPAVGIAFNEIFNFGNNQDELLKKYPKTNWYVYDVLINTAKEYFS